jgi:preprotein translocase subunit SecD
VRRFVALLLVFALAGCTSARVGGVPTKPSATESGIESGAGSGGPVDLEVPLDLARVMPTGATAPTTSTLPDPDGIALPLEPPFLTITRLEDARVEFEQSGGSWGVQLAMTDEDAQVFGEWTSAHIGEQVAVVVDGEVVAAPQIQDAITGGEVTISAQYTQDEANDLLAELTGR